MRARLALALAAILGTLPACDSTADAFVPLPVVSATLEAGQPLGPVNLTRLVPLGATFDPDAAAITGATVEVALLATDGSVEQTVPYEAADEPGVYIPTDLTIGTLPGRTYRLRILAPAASGVGADTLTAETTVPVLIDIVEGPPAEIVYGDGFGPPVRISTSSTASRRAVYLLGSEALAADRFEEVEVEGETRYRQLGLPDRYGLVPFLVTILGCDVEDSGLLLCDEDPADATSGRSPLLNEDSYTLLGDGTAQVPIPFIAFGYYGPARVTFFSLDDAFIDYVETQAIQFAPTTISPGEIPNATTNVRNGLGVFGSFARASVELVVRQAAP